MKLLLGDCLDKLKELDDNSVDSIVTDPPYGLSFMGKKWDYDVPSTEIWEECIRVLKPGGHLLSFAGSRTYHRMAVRIEDAGFEIRDQIMWIYGSGFPKSHNIGKAVDKIEGNEREDIGLHERQNYKKGGAGFRQLGNDELKTDYRLSKGNSQWEGWGTALKPAHEPIVMARKPLVGTVANNVLEWRTGGINIDGCRIGVEPTDDIFTKNPHTTGGFGHGEATIYGDSNGADNYDPSKGRFPANVIFDEEAGKILDEQSGISKSSGGSGDKSMGALGKNGKYGNYALDVKAANLGGLGDTGGASRFFYCPKTSKSDRSEGNIHPTVKPTDLMGYLIRLVTPKGGVVLDPFMGSGSTGKGAVREGMVFIGIERESEYFEIAEARIQNEIDNVGKPKKVSKQKEKRVEPIVENKFWE
jgi:site-specific DNA-methyltransferase (adenine-specific)